MDAFTYLKQRQVQWALRRDIPLEGREGERGARAYCPALDQNLYTSLCTQSRQEYEEGDGNELGGKMRAVHSASAAIVNLFEYWRQKNLGSIIAEACGVPAAMLSGVRYEAKLPIAREVNRRAFPVDPNIDVLLEYAPNSRTKATGIEVKFSEAYNSRGHSGIKPAYLEPGRWFDGLPNLKQFALTICPDDTTCTHLHPAQLVKHVLGLTHRYGKGNFRLLYLWYDLPFDEGCHHRREAQQFAQVAAADGITFQAVTFQEVILRLAAKHRPEHHNYIDYVTERYL